jgi:polar amino acid transport system substrate-binding protein
LVKNRIFRLVHLAHFPPFAMSGQGKSRGLAIDLLDRILAEMDTEAVYIPVDQSGIQDLVDLGRADGIACFASTPERRMRYDFSNPLITSGGGLFIKKSDTFAGDLSSYAGKTISTPQKGPLLSHIKKKYPQIILKATRDYPEAMELVLTDKAAAAALNLHAGISLANQAYPGQFSLPGSAFQKINLAVAAPKGKCPELLQLVNEGLSRLKKGEYHRILEKWMGKS